MVASRRPDARESFPRVTVEMELHVLKDGHVLASAGIDKALRVVAR